MIKLVAQQIVGCNGLDDPNRILRTIEHCGRVAYASWGLETEESAGKFVRMLISRGHESPLEHASITLFVVCDRATAQQLTRHRFTSFTMESQRYNNYSRDKFDNQICVIDPKYKNPFNYEIWLAQMESAAHAYFALLNGGAPPEDARAVLPNAAACTLAMTTNIREWRQILKIRLDPAAQHNIRELARDILELFKSKIPDIVSDIDVDAKK